MLDLFRHDDGYLAKTFGRFRMTFRVTVDDMKQDTESVIEERARPQFWIMLAEMPALFQHLAKHVPGIFVDVKSANSLF